MKPLACLLFVVVIILGVSSECPPQWTTFQGNCYRYGDKVVSWYNAQSTCQASGANLAQVSNKQENDFLKSVAREKRVKCVWLGGDDLFQKSAWEWTNTWINFHAFTDWAEGQPDNWGGDEDCLTLYGKGNYAWDDDTCTGGCNFICSRPSVTTNVG